MKKILITLEISITDDIAKKYPNFSINYDGFEDFAESIVSEYETPIDQVQESLDMFGFSVRALDRNEVKLINIIEEEK
jgi:hypothetical protein